VSVLIIGERDAGRVEVFAGTYVETRFAHVNGLILAPGTSMLVLPNGHRIPIPAHRVSRLAGYGRLFPLLGALGAGIGVFAFDGGTSKVALGVTALGLAGLWLAALRYGTLSSTQIAQREVYRAATGLGCDPALLAFGHPHLEANLQRELSTRAERLSPDGYRAGLGDWRELAVTSAAADPPFLAIALTLARIEGQGELHDAIWARLAPVAGRLPSTIPAVTSAEEAEAAQASAGDAHHPAGAAGPAGAPYEPPPVLATTKGSVVERGFDVTLPIEAYGVPTVCASCLAPAQLTLASKALFPPGKSVQVPYCRACHAHALRQAIGNPLGTLLAVTAGVVASAIALVAGPSVVFSIALGTLAAALVSGLVASAFPPKRAVIPATIGRDAARLVRSSGGKLTLFCRNHEWSLRLAEAYGGTRVATRRIDWRSFVGAAFATACASVVAGGAWHFANPTLRIDNGTGAPVAIWVDGRVVSTVAPIAGAELGSVRLNRGKHVVGWSPAGAAKPTAETELTATIAGGDYLFDPDARHCYWVTAMVYGSAHPAPGVEGAQPVAQMHDMSKIDDWFVASPATESLKHGEGKVRYALERFAICAELAECPAAARAKYWACVGRVTDGNIDGCAPVAREACGWKAR
jgi:hypothetical protein